ncbi:glycosyltransferase family 2 protein [bacterium]|nr:glycosyltransferase family 2 protein [bacterium]
MTIDVTIIIVSFNTKALLLDCLRSLYQWKSRLSCEIIVVDNASRDETPEAVTRNFPGVIVVRNVHNVGFAGANNQGIAIARGKYLLLLNPDTLFVEDAITPLFDFMESHPRTGIAGCKILNADGSLQPSYFPLPNLMTMAWTALFLDRLAPLNHVDGRRVLGQKKLSSPARVQRLLGAYLFTRNETIQQVGAFDDTFFLFCEEDDFCYRVAKQGWEIHHVPTTRIIHLGGQSTVQDNAAAVVHANASRVQYFRKHFGLLTQILFRGIWFLALVMRLCSVLFLRPPWRGQMAKAYLKSLATLFQPLKPKLAAEC